MLWMTLLSLPQSNSAPTLNCFIKPKYLRIVSYHVSGLKLKCLYFSERTCDDSSVVYYDGGRPRHPESIHQFVWQTQFVSFSLWSPVQWGWSNFRPNHLKVQPRAGVWLRLREVRRIFLKFIFCFIFSMRWEDEVINLKASGCCCLSCLDNCNIICLLLLQKLCKG